MKLRIVPLVLLVSLFVAILVLPALATISINDESVFTKQQTDECPLASTVSMLRRRAIIDGKENWNTTYSYEKIKSVAWTKKNGMRYSFDFPSENCYNVYSPSMDLERDLYMGDIEGKKQYFINKLKQHPEGIAAYVFFLANPRAERKGSLLKKGQLQSKSGKSEQHVVLITDYDEKTDTFYCFDPARNMPAGRIKLENSSLPMYIKNAGYWNDSESIQNNILGFIAQTWYITNVSGGGINANAPENVHSTHAYNDRGYCTIGGEEYPISLQSMTDTTYQAINDNTPIRWRPYKPEPIIDRLSKDTAVTVVASGKNAKGNLWYKLDNGTWVYSENVKKPGKPSAPKGFTITKVSKNTARISWNPVAGATSYEVENSSPTSNGWQEDPDYRDKKQLTSYITTGLAANKTYQFQVYAVNSVGRSGCATVTYTHDKSSTSGTATIQYNANGGTGAPASHTVTKDSNGVIRFNLSSTIPTRSGYTFLGWRMENSTAYGIDRPGQSITISIGNVSGNDTLTYYAQWERSSEKLSAPTDFTIIGKSAGTATVYWSPVIGATSYEVEYWSRSWNEWRADYEYSSYLGTPTTSYTTSGLSNHSSYEFRVRAVNSAGKSDWTYVTYIKDEATQQEMQVGKTTIQYNANGGTGAPASHTVTKDSNGVIRFNLSSTRPTRSGYIFLGWRLENSTAYGIDSPGQIIAISIGNVSGNDTLTYYAQWKSSSEKPAAPTNFTIKWKSAGTATVSWSPVTGATSYEVEYWSRSWNEWRADYEYRSYLGTQTTSYTTNGLSNHSSYEFRVRAVNSAGKSDWTYFTYRL